MTFLIWASVLNGELEMVLLAVLEDECKEIVYVKGLAERYANNYLINIDLVSLVFAHVFLLQGYT